MADLTFNTTAGAVVERKLLILYLNTGTSQSPTWSRIGKRVEDSSMEYDWGEESKTDIFGETYTTMKSPVITQTFDPCELDAGDTAQVKIWNMAIKDQDDQQRHAGGPYLCRDGQYGGIRCAILVLHG